jgi:hypothetical protein
VNLRLIVTILVIAAAPVCARGIRQMRGLRPGVLHSERHCKWTYCAKERIKNALKQTFSVRLAAPCRLSSQPKNSMFRSHEAMSARV